VDTLRDLYPPLAPAIEREGGLVSNALPGVAPALPGAAAAPIDVNALAEEVRRASAFLDQVFAEVARVVVGQRDMVERVLIGLLTGGH
jgi:MoxR-like ATPase